MRFVAPARADVADGVFRHPAFAALPAAQLALCRQAAWPAVDDLNGLWQAPLNASGRRYRFVAQDSLDDGLHYEQRIAGPGLIATRRDNWHDLFNALVWMRAPRVKAALNARQVADIAAVGAKQRTRGQCALTHFDEAGAIVRLDDAGMLAAWDAHDWPALFGAWGAAEARGAVQLWLFGHSIHEHALNPGIALVAKALVIGSARALDADAVDALAAARIAAGGCLRDPQELRPIPLSGIPGWHPAQATPDFFRRVPCFRPKRAGKTYPAPITP